MANECCATGGNVMILACSGGSNVGQLSNQAAVELTREGFGKMFCLAGIGGQLSGFVQSARDVPANGGDRRLFHRVCQGMPREGATSRLKPTSS